MLCLPDIVALAIWNKAAPVPPAASLRAALQSNRPEPDPASPPSLASVLSAAGGEAGDAAVAQLRDQAATALRRASEEGMAAIPWGGDLYPPLLAAIPDPPLVLWSKGDAARLSNPAVAIVGARAASPYGIEAASRLSGELAATGMSIVSGLARGVDSAAHRGALAEGGVTIAVLGSGIDCIYPPEHEELAERIAATGVLLSEYPPGTPPLPQHFPRRNRIISGLSLGVVVIEAADRSGSLITAGLALEQGRHVMAVPGNILSGRFRGSHSLLRDGAALVDGADDVLAELRASTLRSFCTAWRRDDEQEADPVLAAMAAGEAYDVDTLARETRLPPASLLPRLLDLELCGVVRRVAGGRFLRAARTC